ncbi:MAG TPA: ferric reductase-like transmembrane domain-containing protein [Acetobacteraceae bacterium]|jgi:sulfoxide reductase heme-binding subunit YedZ|nr:ferric reductase-like transmembrane domain-containing protein [Acetobacteraceae bacterium]
MIIPWRDRHGRFLPLKATMLAAAFIPGAVLAWWWANGMLGGRPVTEVIHGTGDWAIRTLLISLAITPAARVLDWPRLLLVRRIVGLTALAYAVAHLTLYVVDQKYRLGVVVSEIALRFYLTIGFVVLLGLGLLGATSTDSWVQRLGRRWKVLHRSIYLLGTLALLHYFIQAKSNVSEPVFFSGLFVWLLAWRALPMAWQRSLFAQLALTAVAALAAAGIEFAWYGLTTGIDPWRVLAASESLRFGLRPAHYVALAGLAVVVLAGLRRIGGMVRMRPRLAA